MTTPNDPPPLSEAIDLDTAEVPGATYRIQFHAGMRFDDATRAVPYLRALGISHLYASPYLKARAGSTHGYDIVDHNQLNPEIGDSAAHARLCAALAEHGLQQLLDIVPNHMGVLEADNAWWQDVLECGQASIHAHTFDIDWQPPALELHGRVLLPVLGDQYGCVLERGELQLVFEPDEGGFALRYYAHRFPIDPRCYPLIFAAAQAPAPESSTMRAALAELQTLIDAFGALPARDDLDPQAVSLRRVEKIVLKQRLSRSLARQPWLQRWIDAALLRLNGQAGEPRSVDALDALVQRQAYRLAFWRVAGDDVNYRRFFDVSTLAALRTERPEVFEATHRSVLGWLKQGLLAGLRIDHPDGLCDPRGYFERLQAHHAQGRQDAGQAPRALYIAVEKILAEHEHLPDDWPVHGDTGYRFGSLVGGLFVDGANEAAMDAVYAGHIGHWPDFDSELHAAKHLIMTSALAGDLQLLTETLHRIAAADRRTCDFTRNRLRAALAELAAAFPVYRSYLGERGASANDRQHIAWATAAAKRRSPASELSAIDFVHDVLLGAAAEPEGPSRRAKLDFVYRWQQFTAPVMAKSMEDTAFYRYHRLVSLNEVGGDPRRFGTSVEAFHAANLQRARFHPHCLLGTSTHDSKRSEDVRARLAVLSEMPFAWRDALQRFVELNRPRAERSAADVAPNDEYLLYQTLVGVWPLGPLDATSLDGLRLRVQAYMLKALREAKQRSSWVNPNPDYEAAMQRLVDQLLGLLTPNLFLKELQSFVDAVATFGCWNSLNQLVFKLTAPGVPDIYQGCESWDFSLVDPDNRRPVDLPALARQLEQIRAAHAAARGNAGALLREWVAALADGRLKQFVTWRTLQLRAHRPTLFRNGAYQPLAVHGPAAGHVVAYARSDGEAACVVIGTRLLARLSGGHAGVLAGGACWAGTQVTLPPGEGWREIYAGQTPAVQKIEGEQRIDLAELLGTLPFAVLVNAPV